MCIHCMGTEAGLEKMTNLPAFSRLNERTRTRDTWLLVMLIPRCCKTSHLVSAQTHISFTEFNLVMTNNPYHARKEDIQFNILVYHLFIMEETCSICPTLLLYL